MPYWLQLVVQISFSYLATCAFAICINIPRKALNACGIAGSVGWIVYWLLKNLSTGRMVANLMGALAIGFCGILMARRKGMPVIIFNIPALVPLVPGATAYRAIRALVLGNIDLAIQLIVSVTMVAGSIAVGFMLAQLIGELTVYHSRSLPKLRRPGQRYK
ncbi:hypothetical protein IV38_GL001858 [Lactobacillus selangorensis]|uniref:Threonine/Serine exporter ThrE domain-containing protein n=1 Tax=Lactobacillus selangorensis TaxID=81857 RepID=A0A0R2FHB1_9LACO|nr:threonine/serine exporter family protein [Lactobacillus selangorensis]KRN28017.1 hypothetical protein IV38_GL001858 [Lactobacillus selangorensis]KRN30512.1 hypothetical protein IV40_GL001697 [Lactobacillus selangorensis]